MAINSLIDHIAGHGSDGGVTIGVNTPAPYAGANVTGFIDGTGPQNASKNMAEFYNRQVFAYKHLLESAGISFDAANWAQMTQAITTLITANTPQINLSGYVQHAQQPASAGANGYQKMSSGIIFQWGKVTVNNSASNSNAAQTNFSTVGVNAFYPLAFPNAVLSVQATGGPNQSNPASFELVEHTVACVGANTTYAALQARRNHGIPDISTETFDLSWFAVGY